MVVSPRALMSRLVCMICVLAGACATTPSERPDALDDYTLVLRDSPEESQDILAQDASTDHSAVDATDGTVVSSDVRLACPDDMVHVQTFCVDRYEAPNVRGAFPLAFRTAIEGERWCSARGKRMCTDVEWTRACRGPTAQNYPYGERYVRGRCTDDRTWRSPSWSALGTYPSAAAMLEAERLYQADPSGLREGCVSPEGAHDLTGNVAEWVVRTIPNSTNYSHVMKGCYWAGCFGSTPPSCSFVNPAHPATFRSYEAGFRCCSDALP
ncbi:MAG: SUMF1/EgtB/PvdO family nonheme iron enzyme [Deltaproteobacteria bacterium]|nr:SUMF1/EgtB/PvdO family nonheme iron enzyme [Deltaproteobacteria bacterium]